MLSKEYFDYHLTPNGWVEGTEKLDFSTTERSIPEDRVLTLRIIEEIPHPNEGFRYEQVVWKSDDINLLNKLKKKFGARP